MKKIILPLLFIAVLGGIWVTVTFKHPQPEQKTAGAEKPAQGSTNGVAPSNSSRAVEHQISQTKTPVAAGNRAYLSNLMGDSSDFKAFVKEAIKHPELGGYSYAVKVLGLCSTIRGFAKAKEGQQVASQDPRVSAATKDMLEKCKGFTGEDFAKTQTLITEGREKGDILLQALGDKFSAAYSGEPPANGKEVLRIALSGDPVLLVTAGQVIFHHRLSENVLFQGKKLSDYSADQRKEIAAAFDLLQCEFGAECGKDSLALKSVCVYGNCGFANLEELTRATFSLPGSRFDWSRVIATRDALVQELKSGAQPLTWTQTS